MRYNKKQLYTESVFMPLSTPTRFVKQNLESSKNFMRIVVIKSHYPKYPVNLSFCTIDSKLVYNESLTNESLGKLSKVIELTKVQVDFRKSYSTNFCPSSEATLLQDPPQWKYRVPPTVEIRGVQWKLRWVDPADGKWYGDS